MSTNNSKSRKSVYTVEELNAILEARETLNERYANASEEAKLIARKNLAVRYSEVHEAYLALPEEAKSRASSVGGETKVRGKSGTWHVVCPFCGLHCTCGSDVEDKDPVAEVHRMLKCHDWWYHYSDDHNVWKRGQAREAAIQAALAKLDGYTADALWNNAAPKAE